MACIDSDEAVAVHETMRFEEEEEISLPNSVLQVPTSGAIAGPHLQSFWIFVTMHACKQEQHTKYNSLHVGSG